jgi:o-succinylbenzoate---CoA ligase
VSSLSVLDAALEQPRAPAVVLATGVVDYAELAARVQRRLAALSLVRSAAPGALVSVSADNTLPGLESILALLEAGVPFVPLHPRLTDSERRALQARLSVTFHVEADAERTETTAFGAEGLATSSGSSPRGSARDPEAPLALIMTSGTSGAPRAALLSRRAFLAAAAASAKNLGWHDDDRWLLCLPLAHIGGLSVVTRCVLARKPIVLAESWPLASSGEAALAALVDGRATLASVVPTQLMRWLELVPQSQPLPSRVRAILTGGAATSAALLAASAERGWPVLTTYGSTEACSQIATQAPAAAATRAEGGCGWPLDGVSVKLDGGRICVKGPTLFSGYHPPAEPAFDADGWFRTQDLGRFDADGQLHVLGRADEVIISGAENVAPWEVERVLESCPGVLQACVFGVPDARWGQSVVAALRIDERRREAVLAHLLALVNERLASFRRPRQLACLDEFVLNATGKVDRRRTAERARPLLAAWR